MERTVVYACDNNYIKQTIISMISLLKSNCYPIEFWIVSDRLSDENRELLLDKTAEYERTVQFLDIESVLNGVVLSGEGRHPRTIYAKLFLSKWVHRERVLYLDSDTVVTGELEELWNRNMKNELVAGVQMPYSNDLKSKMNLDPSSPYLCDGIVLFNLQLWRKGSSEQKCREYIARCEGCPPMQSEGTLNFVCQGKMGVLQPRYNLMPQMLFYTAKQIQKLFQAEKYYCETEIVEARENPAIIHFINELYNRPWYEPCDHPCKEAYQKIEMELFEENAHIKQNISKRTRLAKRLFFLLPFPVFTFIYQIKHKVMDGN